MSSIKHYHQGVYSIDEPDKDRHIIGRNRQMRELYVLVNRLAKLPTTVLLRGESGTGKELVASALHYNGERHDERFVAVNCAGIPSELLESELFGHERGAYTGAHAMRYGFVRRADRGTLFLDEIGDMSFNLQAKILRLLQEKEVTPIGSSYPVPVDVRLVAATNQKLESLVKKKKFREDLFYRLSVYPLTIPPLRERPSDISLLADYFLVQFSKVHGKRDISLAALEKLQDHNWPGNVRELQNVLESALIRRRRGEIRQQDISFTAVELGEPFF